jgi:hypothetical protein
MFWGFRGLSNISLLVMFRFCSLAIGTGALSVRSNVVCDCRAFGCCCCCCCCCCFFFRLRCRRFLICSFCLLVVVMVMVISDATTGRTPLLGVCLQVLQARVPTPLFAGSILLVLILFNKLPAAREKSPSAGYFHKTPCKSGRGAEEARDNLLNG